MTGSFKQADQVVQSRVHRQTRQMQLGRTTCWLRLVILDPRVGDETGVEEENDLGAHHTLLFVCHTEDALFLARIVVSGRHKAALKMTKPAGT